MIAKNAVLISLLCSVASGLNRVNITDGFMAQKIDECTVEGQLKIRDEIKSLLQGKLKGGPVATTKSALPFEVAKWPADPLEDGDLLKDVPADKKWKMIGLIKAFNPVFFFPQLAKEIRDNMMCNFKRMECMSIDDIAYPIESIMGTRATYALYDALPEEAKPGVDAGISELRKRVIEPMMLMIYKSQVEPSKTQVEGLIPKGYPYDAVPSMPSSIEGDWDIKAAYPSVGTANLPGGIESPEWGPSSRSPYKSGYSLVEQDRKSKSLMEIAEESRAQCSERPTELKKLMCELDFGMVFLRLGEDAKKKGEAPKLSKEDQDTVLDSLAQIGTKLTEVQQTQMSSMPQCAK